jgi:hypothetical protein
MPISNELMERLKHRRELDLAWAAGIIDGEGYVGVTTPRQYFYARRAEMIYMKSYVVLKVNMTHRGTIDRLRILFGRGSVWEQKPRKVGNKKQWEYRAANNIAIAVLREIQPYAVTKKERIDHILQMVDSGEPLKPTANVRRKVRQI